MFCSKCGTPIPDGCTFCPNCGTKVDPPAQNSAVGIVTAAAAAVTPASVPVAKKRHTKWLPWAIVVIVVIVLAVLLKGLLGGPSFKGDFVYLSDGNYYLLKDIAKDPLQFASLRESDQFYNMVNFSEDGKYIYYFSKADTDTQTGTLCRAQVSKIKNDDSDSVGEILDSNVQYYSLIILDNGDVLYNDGDNNLKFYHDGQSIQISRTTTIFYLSKDESSLVYLEPDEDSDNLYTMYGIKLTDPEAPVKLASNVSYIENADNANCISYVTYEDDSDLSYSLYVTDFSGNTEKIADQVSYSLFKNDTLYYMVLNGSKVSPYDYVDDPLAAQDASAIEPQIDNYEVPYYRYNSLGADADPNDYTELYTSCTRGLERFSYGWDSMDDVAEDTSDMYNAATKTAVQSFIDKYESKQDEDGYLLVTDEVRNDLKSINATIEDAQDSEWISLCFSKEQSGTTTDYDTYSKDLEAYNEVKERNDLRKELQSADGQIDVRTFYAYNTVDKSTTMIMDNIVANQFVSPIIRGFLTVDQVTNKIAIQDISSPYDVVDMINSMNSGTVALFDFKSGKMVATMNGEDFSEATDLHICGNTLLMVNKDEELLSAPLSNGNAGSLSILAENVQIDVQIDDDTLYYYADVYDNSDGESFGDYYCYANGTSTLIVRDTQTSNVTIYKDGPTFAGTRTGQNEKDQSVYEINIINEDGESTYLADGLTQLFCLGKNKILYVSDGDLYFYNGKERKHLAENVDYVWYTGELQEIQNSKSYL